MAKTIQWRKYSLFNKWCWNNSIFTQKKNEFGPLSYDIYNMKIYSKWMKGLNVSTKATHLLEGNIVIYLYDLGLDDSFINMTPKSQGTKEKN